MEIVDQRKVSRGLMKERGRKLEEEGEDGREGWSGRMIALAGEKGEASGLIAKAA